MPGLSQSLDLRLVIDINRYVRELGSHLVCAFIAVQHGGCMSCDSIARCSNENTEVAIIVS